MYAIWITGLPGSGKSTITAVLLKQLRARGQEPAVLESDVFRRFFTPRAAYSEEERTAFYEGMAHIGHLLYGRGVPVIFDATANRRAYRQKARELIPRLVEVYVDCPLEICMERDPKGLYKQARAGGTSSLPGLQVEYEPPDHPDVHIRSDHEDPESAARRIVSALVEQGLLPKPRSRRTETPKIV